MESNTVNEKHLLKDAKKLILSSKSEDVEKGLKALKKIIKSDPNNLWAFIYYGVGAYKSEKRCHEAVIAFETACNINEDLVEGWKGIRACLENKVRSAAEDQLLAKGYINLLRLENDPDEWKTTYDKVWTTDVLPLTLKVYVLSSLLGDYTSKSFKHEVACRDLSSLAFQHSSLLLTNTDQVLLAFESWANFLDFSDRPEFCKKVCSYLTKLKLFKALSVFLHHTLIVYGSKLYLKIQLVQYIIDIALDSLDNVEDIIPLVKKPMEDVEGMKLGQIKLALCIVHFFDDFSVSRHRLENMSCMGDINATLFLLKFLCKVKDYESVLFICMKFGKMFSTISDDSLKGEFLCCLLEALSTCNEVSLLESGVKLGLKTVSKYGEKRSTLNHLYHCYLGLNDPKAVYYLKKLTDENRDCYNYLLSLLKPENPVKSDPGSWLHSSLLAATQHLVNNEIKKAVKSFTKIGVKDKYVSDPFLVLGVDSLYKGDISRASSCFHRAFSLRPLDPVILKHYLDSLLKLDDEQSALRVLDSVWSGNFGKWHLTGEKALFSSALIHSAKMNHEKSVLSFKHLIKLNPDCLEFVEAISDEYVRLGRLGIAENYLSRLILDDPCNLHTLLLLSEIYKLDVNYSSYFNQSLRCINFNPDENQGSLKVMKLILCFFINFLRQNSKWEESSRTYFSQLCANILMKLDNFVSKGSVERTKENEYAIALYKYIESHFLGAVKLMKTRRDVDKVKKLLNFSIRSIGKALEIYGAHIVAMWKLLGDIFLTSSQLNCDLEVFSWLLDSDGNGPEILNVSSISRLNLSVKCYIVALNINESQAPDRAFEFYYDIGVALLSLANHPVLDDPQTKYLCLKSSLEACLKSFQHSDGVSESRWIHSNLLGVIVSQMGVRESMFKEHFSSNEIRMCEGLMLQNYAVHLAKTGLYNHAEQMFEQARQRVDMEYSSSWVGQLLMQLFSNDIETKKMIQYNLTDIGHHSFFKWILAYFLVKHRCSSHFDGSQHSLLNYIFPVDECIAETNPSRLTLMAYVHESIGNLSLARRLYFRALRLGKYVDRDTYSIFLSNAVRLNLNCRQNIDLLKEFDSNVELFLPTISLYNINTRHISILDVNRPVLFKTLVLLKNLSGSLSSDGSHLLALVTPLVSFLSDINLFKYLDAKVPFVIEYLIKNVVLMLKTCKKDFKQFVSSLDTASRTVFIKNIRKLIGWKSLGDLTKSCLVSNDSVNSLMKNSIGDVRISRWDDRVSLSCVRINESVDCTDCESKEMLSSPHTVLIERSISDSDSSSPYVRVMNDLRESIFPLPLTDEERMILKRKKILQLQQMNAPQPEKKKAQFVPGSYLDLKEAHGCHYNSNLIVTLLRKSISEKNYSFSLKLAHICLNIKCSSCLESFKMIPLLCVVSVETDNVKLIQKALHLYPYNSILRKTALWFFTKVSR